MYFVKQYLYANVQNAYTYIHIIYIHFRFDWIELQGNKYSCGNVIWCGDQDDGLSQFGKICDIMRIRSHIFST